MRTFHQKLVIFTAVIAILVITSAGLYQLFRIPEPLEIVTHGQPTIGSHKAKVEVVIFEDFLCPECALFNDTIFPQIESEYVATNQVRYTLVPVSFIDGSKPLANAALAVYHMAPDKFFQYAQALFQSARLLQNADVGQLVDIAEAIGGIDERELKKAIATRRYDPELERNLMLAKKLMGNGFGTPALYVNGVATSTGSFRAVQARIERALYLGGKQ